MNTQSLYISQLLTSEMNTNTGANDHNVLNNKHISCNDVIAIANNNHGFRIGKVNETKENLINITLFHYKLDTKTEITTQNDVILNFGPHGAKSIFEMNDEQQKMLLNRVYELDPTSTSLLSSMAELKCKEEVLMNMETKLAQLLDRLFIVDDCPQLFTKILNDEIINLEEMFFLIFDHVQKSDNEAKLDSLAKLLAQVCMKKKSLQYVEHHLNLIINEEAVSPCKIFLKKCLKEISDLIEKTSIDDVDLIFTIHFARLVAVAIGF